MVTLRETGLLIAQNFSLNEGIILAKPLLLFILGLAFYSLFIFKFYRFLARREIFKINFVKQDSFSKGLMNFYYVFVYLLKYLLLYPLFLLFWVITLSVILAFLSKQNTIETVLLISVALVGVIRVMAFYKEDLSKDLAKMMPFALLGVFLVDITYFSTSESLNSIIQLPSYWKLFAYYLLILIIIEFSLRLLFVILKLFNKNETSNK